MKLRITTSAYQDIIRKIGSGIPEKGGLLMGKDGIVTDFIFDQNANTTSTTYELNIGYLNPLIKLYKRQGYELLGIVHSHPYGCKELSPQDKDYFKSQFSNFPALDRLYTPIVFSAKQNEFEFFPYIMKKEGTVELAELEILPNNYKKFVSKISKPNKQTIAMRKELLKNVKAHLEKYVDPDQSNQLRFPVKQTLLFVFTLGLLTGVCVSLFPLACISILKP